MTTNHTHSIHAGRRPAILATCLLAGLLASCGSPKPTVAPEAEATEVWAEVGLNLGPGEFDLTEMQTGLDGLSSYRAALTLSFEGTESGQAAQWSSDYVMLRSTTPPAWQFTVGSTGTDMPAEYEAEMNGVFYGVDPDGYCGAAVIDAAYPTERPEPADLLTGVLGAEPIGHQVVEGIEADGYSFDERGLAQEGLTESQGEFWLATEGGYLLRYHLTTQADEGFFGQGMTGTMTWDYVLSDIGAPVTFSLPVDCPPGLVDAPRLPDASGVVDAPGYLAYDSATSVPDALAFYKQELPALGWEEWVETAPGMEGLSLSDEELKMLESFFPPGAAEEDEEPMLDYIRGEDVLRLILTSEDNVTHVLLLLDRRVE